MEKIGKKLPEESSKEWFHRYYLINKKEILERNHSWYYSNIKKVREQYRRSFLRRKLLRLKRVFEYKIALGGKCKKCGYSENLLILEVHHLNGRTDDIKRKNILNQPGFQMFCKTRIIPEDVELLCPNCHRNIHHPIEEYLQFKKLVESM